MYVMAVAQRLDTTVFNFEAVPRVFTDMDVAIQYAYIHFYVDEPHVDEFPQDDGSKLLSDKAHVSDWTEVHIIEVEE